MAERTTECDTCGDTFVAPGTRGRLPKYCSDDCQPRCGEDGCNQPHLARGMCSTHYGQWHRSEHGTGPTYYYDKTCEVCGAEFQHTSPDVRTCGADNDYRCRWFIDPRAVHQEEVPWHKCQGCGEWWIRKGTTSTYCTDECRPETSPPPPFDCQVCGTHCTPGDNVHHLATHYCSGRCATKGKRALPSSRRAKAAHKQRRRARKYGADAERFDPEEIFERDNWRCQLCGHKTRPDWNYLHPLAPTIDHIIPLAQGGNHTRKNTQTAHRRCNSDKSDGAANDQLRLVG